MATIYHAINLSKYPTDSRLWVEQLRTIASIENYRGTCDVVNIAVGDCDMPLDIIPESWRVEYLKRTARTEIYDVQKNYPYIHDIFNILSACSKSSNDWCMLTNSDCMITEHTYSNIFSCDSEVVALRRSNILQDDSVTIHQYGTDGMALNVSFWDKIKPIWGDYILGAVSWDTSIVLVAESITSKVSHHYGALHHHHHDVLWSLTTPRVEDSYNISLSYALLENYFNLSDIYSIPANNMWAHATAAGVSTNTYTYSDISVIMCIWGTNKQYIANARNAILKLREQSENFELIFVEFIPEDSESGFSDMPIDKHIIIKKYRYRHRYIFQKNVLWNIGGACVVGNKKLIFMDCDVVSENKSWLNIIRQRLDNHWNTVLQGFRYVYDYEEPDLCRYSTLYCTVSELRHRLKNPGLCYGMSKKYFDAMGGFNAIHGVSGVDAIFMVELGLLKNEYVGMSNWLANNRGVEKIESIARAIPEAQLDYAPVDIIHLSHGKFSTRRYGDKLWWRLNLTETFPNVFCLDEFGVLKWNNVPDHIRKDYDTILKQCYD